MKTDFTPGPWKQTGTNVRTKDGGLICTVANHWADTTTPLAEKEANARLISAAPELLEALEWIVDDWERVTERTLPDDHPTKAAIAKARGTDE